ncbi:MAG: hypothetical protein AAGA54_32545 [Myxococcota bacterium]
MSVLASVKKYIRLPPGQVQEVVGDRLSVSEVEKAIVLFVPPWSADAIVVLRKLSEVLGEFPSVGLILVDPTTLGPTVVSELELVEAPQGYGEAVWISRGVVSGMVSRKSYDWERKAQRITAEVAAVDVPKGSDRS